MARVVNDITKYQQRSDRLNVQTIITFRTQQLFDLWINEMQGQISDGMWENSRHTDWLWKNTYLRLGNETKVEVCSLWRVGRKSFGMTGELWSIIGSRIMDENGFATEKEAKAAWREIAQAIAKVDISKGDIEKLISEARAEKKASFEAQWPSLHKEWEEAGVECIKYSSYYGVTLYYQAYIDEENKKDSIKVETMRDRDDNLITHISYNNNSYRVGRGQLKKALEALRTFVNTMKEVSVSK